MHELTDCFKPVLKTYLFVRFCSACPFHSAYTYRLYLHGAAYGGKKGKCKGFPYSMPSVGPGADPGVQVQVTVSHPPGGRLPLLSARPAVTSPAVEHLRPLKTFISP